MRKVNSFITVGLLLLILCIANVSGQNTGSNDNASQAGIWLSSADRKNLLAYQGTVDFADRKTDNAYTINIDENHTYQQMDGFGASFTDSSAWLVAKKLDDNARQTLMKKLFDYQEGIGLSLLRQPIGASDFARRVYSYDDMPSGQTDPSLANFSIAHDLPYIIPLLKEASKLNPFLKIMATPWSPPGWMKDTGFMAGKSNGMESQLLKEYYSVYAEYLVKFIKAYEEQGIPIYALTVQNEPQNTPEKYPGMRMNANEQIDFITNHLGPAFARNKIKTKIICWDQNFDNLKYATQVLEADSKTNFISGSAWHFYGGSHETMSEVHRKFPDKGVWFTEGSGGYWGAGTTWRGAFLDEMWHIIRIPRHWGQSVIWWNIALDEKNGPSLLGDSNCRGIIKIDQKTVAVTYNVDYYAMGHISKFVHPGAWRIESNTFDNVLENVAFKNPDCSKVLIVYNRTTAPITFQAVCGSKTFQYTIPGEAAVTFKW